MGATCGEGFVSSFSLAYPQDGRDNVCVGDKNNQDRADESNRQHRPTLRAIWSACQSKLA